MKISRHFSKPDVSPYDEVEYEQRSCVIRNADGSVVYEMHDVEVPRDWSQLASDILISKYIRKAGLGGSADSETSAQQVIGRVVRCIRGAGERMGNYFDSSEDATVFEQELTSILLHQRGAFNSPVWFNAGLYDSYGIKGGGGNWHWSDKEGALEEVENNYEHPQCSACFIQSVEDDLMSIFGLVKNEARIFKYGSGSGTNFSKIRGRQEVLSGGGTSSGLMSFLEVFDRAAGATKSGGTTRRAAKMVCLDADHPEIRDFVAWKGKEEKKARALIAAGYPADFNGEAYRTVGGQNSNNSVRLTDEFMRAYMTDGDWQTILRTTGEVCETFPARQLMRDICDSAWECADPGLQFDTTINDWHTCSGTGRIEASNPCSEFMFLDNSACNLASINLLKYVNEDGSFDVPAFLHTVRIFILAQEILVDASSYPGREIALNSHLFRPLGLGYANLGSVLMVRGLPYDSDGGRALAATITSIMTAHAYRISAEIASKKKPFDSYDENRDSMLCVMRKHRDEVDNIKSEYVEAELLNCAREQWDDVLVAGDKFGFRNAQVSVLAPTGTIGFLMDCDTTGVEPDYSLVKFKKLAGGGFFKIVNRSVPRALSTLGYDETEVQDILEYVLGTQCLDDAPHINLKSLCEKGMAVEDVEKLNRMLSAAMDLGHVFAAFGNDQETIARLGIDADDANEPGFNLLSTLGYTEKQIDEATCAVCGSMTVEGAPHLKVEHYPVFDCANKCGHMGERFIQPLGHILMMAAVQPFISGAISKTVNLPNSTTSEQIESIYRKAWEQGLKAVALYRDGCKSSQPLSSTKDKEKEEETIVEAPPEIAEEKQLEIFPELAEAGARRHFLPKRRGGITIESRVAGHKIFLRTGEYENGDLGEIFIDMHKEGSSFRSLIMCFSIVVSKGLQYGVPLREFVDTFTFTNFEPRGICDHPNIKMVTSVIDFVFRVLGMEYLGRTDFCQIKPDFEKNDSYVVAGRGLPRAIGSRRRMPKAPASPAPVDEMRPDLEELKSGKKAVSRGNGGSPLDQHLSELMGDAPFCDVCGHITVRNGACYKCLNCGNSMGCS